VPPTAKKKLNKIKHSSGSEKDGERERDRWKERDPRPLPRYVSANTKKQKKNPPNQTTHKSRVFFCISCVDPTGNFYYFVIELVAIAWGSCFSKSKKFPGIPWKNLPKLTAKIADSPI